MRAAVVREFGPISSHVVGELPDPMPGPGEVLVTIKAAAVNYVDSLVVTGKYQFLPERPFTPGKLPTGEISALGSGVSEFKIGDRVLTLAEQGGYAEQVSVDARQCFQAATVHELHRSRFHGAGLRHLVVRPARTSQGAKG